MKCMVVMEKPPRCFMCPLHKWSNPDGPMECYATGIKFGVSLADICVEGFPDWCPLQDIEQ